MSAVLAPFGLMSSCDPPVFSTAPGLALLRELTGARFDAALLSMVKKVLDPWTAPFQQLRRELGLPPVVNPLFEGQFSPYATLALYSKWMAIFSPIIRSTAISPVLSITTALPAPPKNCPRG